MVKVFTFGLFSKQSEFCVDAHGERGIGASRGSSRSSSSGGECGSELTMTTGTTCGIGTNAHFLETVKSCHADADLLFVSTNSPAIYVYGVSEEDTILLHRLSCVGSDVVGCEGQGALCTLSYSRSADAVVSVERHADEWGIETAGCNRVVVYFGWRKCPAVPDASVTVDCAVLVNTNQKKSSSGKRHGIPGSSFNPECIACCSVQGRIAIGGEGRVAVFELVVVQDQPGGELGKVRGSAEVLYMIDVGFSMVKHLSLCGDLVAYGSSCSVHVARVVLEELQSPEDNARKEEWLNASLSNILNLDSAQSQLPETLFPIAKEAPSLVTLGFPGDVVADEQNLNYSSLGCSELKCPTIQVDVRKNEAKKKKNMARRPPIVEYPVVMTGKHHCPLVVSCLSQTQCMKERGILLSYYLTPERGDGHMDGLVSGEDPEDDYIHSVYLIPDMSVDEGKMVSSVRLFFSLPREGFMYHVWNGSPIGSGRIRGNEGTSQSSIAVKDIRGERRSTNEFLNDMTSEPLLLSKYFYTCACSKVTCNDIFVFAHTMNGIEAFSSRSLAHCREGSCLPLSAYKSNYLDHVGGNTEKPEDMCVLGIHPIEEQSNICCTNKCFVVFPQSSYSGNSSFRRPQPMGSGKSRISKRSECIFNVFNIVSMEALYDEIMCAANACIHSNDVVHRTLLVELYFLLTQKILGIQASCSEEQGKDMKDDSNSEFGASLVPDFCRSVELKSIECMSSRVCELLGDSFVRDANNENYELGSYFYLRSNLSPLTVFKRLCPLFLETNESVKVDDYFEVVPTTDKGVLACVNIYLHVLLLDKFDTISEERKEALGGLSNLILKMFSVSDIYNVSTLILHCRLPYFSMNLGIQLLEQIMLVSQPHFESSNISLDEKTFFDSLHQINNLCLSYLYYQLGHVELAAKSLKELSEEFIASKLSEADNLLIGENFYKGKSVAAESPLPSFSSLIKMMYPEGFVTGLLNLTKYISIDTGLKLLEDVGDLRYIQNISPGIRQFLPDEWGEFENFMLCIRYLEAFVFPVLECKYQICRQSVNGVEQMEHNSSATFTSFFSVNGSDSGPLLGNFVKLSKFYGLVLKDSNEHIGRPLVSKLKKTCMRYDWVEELYVLDLASSLSNNYCRNLPILYKLETLFCHPHLRGLLMDAKEEEKLTVLQNLELSLDENESYFSNNLCLKLLAFPLFSASHRLEREYTAIGMESLDLLSKILISTVHERKDWISIFELLFVKSTLIAEKHGQERVEDTVERLLEFVLLGRPHFLPEAMNSIAAGNFRAHIDYEGIPEELLTEDFCTKLTSLTKVEHRRYVPSTL
eukprot:Nk52_evm78s224 gene=Nk52_evmTU78s224